METTTGARKMKEKVRVRIDYEGVRFCDARVAPEKVGDLYKNSKTKIR